MTNFLLALSIVLFLCNCSLNNKDSTSKNNQIINVDDSNSFSKFDIFLSEFKQKSLPDSFVLKNIHEAFYLINEIDDSSLINFLSFEDLYSLKHTNSSYPNRYNYINSYKINSNNLAITYGIRIPPMEYKVKLAIISLKEKLVKTQVTLFATDYDNYLTQSWINKDSIIEILSIFNMKNFEDIDFEKLKENTIITEVRKSYKIDKNGNLLSLGEINIKKCVAKFNPLGFYNYPIENSEINIYPLLNEKMWNSPMDKAIKDYMQTKKSY